MCKLSFWLQLHENEALHKDVKIGSIHTPSFTDPRDMLEKLTPSFQSSNDFEEDECVSLRFQ